MAAQPNIVWIMADDMGFSDIGCYGSEISTPHLDRLAADGLRLTQMYNNARCCPTRASLLTGLYPHQAGIGHMIRNYGIPAYQGFLRDECPTIAEVLRAGGYQTGMAGKWHVGGKYTANAASWTPGEIGYPIPTQRGFDSYYGTLCGACSYYNPHTLMEQDRLIQPSEEQYYYTDAISDRAVSMIDQFHSNGKPFFLYVAYSAPHWPLHALPEDIAKYADTYREGWDELRRRRYEKLVELGIIQADWPLSPRDAKAPAWERAAHPQWEAMRMAVYAAQIDRMDQGIGNMMGKLRQLGIDSNTIVVFLSDNGGCAEFLGEDGMVEQNVTPMRDGSPVFPGNTPQRAPGGPESYMSYDLPWANASNTPFRLYKHWVHEGGISTPCIIHWPDGSKARGDIAHQPAHVIDLMATCLDIAGLRETTAAQAGEGESLLPLLQMDSWERSKPIFWEHEGNRAVREGKWKLVCKYNEQWELYDMERDRTEGTDLARDYPHIVQRLESLYKQWAERCGVIPWEQLTFK